jgi:hypothetical protein
MSRRPASYGSRALAAATLVLLTSGCAGVTGAAGPPGPTAPYAEAPAVQSSEAVPVPAAGEVGQMARGLGGIGFVCLQVRSTDEVAQVWCSRHEERLEDVVADPVTTVDIISTLDGRLGHLRTSQPDSPSSPQTSGDDQSDTVLRELLGVSVLAAWLEDAADVDAVLAGARAHDFGIAQSLHDPREPSRAAAESEHGQFFAVEGSGSEGDGQVSGLPPLTVVIATDQLPDGPWPTGSDFALRTPVEAAPGLEAGGFDCYGPDESPCTRPQGNQQVDYGAPLGRTEPVLNARVGIGGGPRDDGSMTTLADAGFPQGLTFLQDRVKAAVEARVQQARVDGLSFTGVVAGAVVVIDADSWPARQPDEAAYVTVTVGAPLVHGLAH